MGSATIEGRVEWARRSSSTSRPSWTDHGRPIASCRHAVRAASPACGADRSVMTARRRTRLADPRRSAGSRTAWRGRPPSGAARPGPRRNRRSRGSLRAPSSNQARPGAPHHARLGARRHRAGRRWLGKQTAIGRIEPPSAFVSCARIDVSVPSNLPTAAVTSGFRRESKRRTPDTAWRNCPNRRRRFRISISDRLRSRRRAVHDASRH